MTAQEAKKYCDFMYNRKNIRNCEQCHENQGESNWQNRLPCGQQNCWVELHCSAKTAREMP